MLYSKDRHVREKARVGKPTERSNRSASAKHKNPENLGVFYLKYGLMRYMHIEAYTQAHLSVG
ncbi:MAG: hypothetical protein A2931_03465 [Candidatus Niyogibacteria bacterium RIFCSPLOWO2_01_FULL_45_48]|uniref:Uncharacterized protein n=1 Tax=Candidatus Niyogibacteria bacterium RIFCSPLOWO2_01_FULL_45_48 TaxID=1801724 RepID=A0A1G2EYZ7_9BACT|nr:MAG: hypothetical protein A2931_03465 [Candidatus Niyogibacteria bacterium RIFCSPLOWO2_01_FULL_45_48]